MKKALVYGKETLAKHIREKRAIPICLIFSGVSAIGGLLIKGFNAISNYKKSTAVARVMKELYKAQEIDHKWLQRCEHHTSLMAKAKKTAFTHIDGKTDTTGCQARKCYVQIERVYDRKLQINLDILGRLLYLTD